MLKGLTDRGVRPVVVLPDTDGICQTLSDMGIQTITLNYRFCTYPPLSSLTDWLLFIPRLAGRLYLNRKASKQLKDMLGSHRPDLIHTNVSVIDIGYKAAKALRIPHIYHIREYGDIDFNLHYIPTHRLLEHRLRRPMSYSICITKDIQRHHRQSDNTSSRVIYNGIMESREHMPAGSGNYFLFAGRIEPAKGLDFLLEAYKDYARNTPTPHPLHIAGGAPDEKYKEYIKKTIRDFRITEHVTLLGERNDMEQLMLNATAVVIPSRFEGFGRVMPEAMSNGCLVIGRNTGGTKEQMDNGVRCTGGEIALRFDTTEELTTHMLNVTSRPVDSFDAYRERAFRAVNALYTTETNAENVYKFYQDILHHHAKSH